MTTRRRLLDWLRRRWERRVAEEPAEVVPGLPRPIRPTRMIVSGGLAFGDRGRLFEQAHLVVAPDPRFRLWRDTSVVLIVFALAIAAGDWLPKPPQQQVLGETFIPTQFVGEPLTGSPSESVTAIASDSPAASPTSSEATPTPSSTSRATPVTGATPGPSHPPTATPTAHPTPAPTLTAAPPTDTPVPPTDTPVPPPHAVIGTPICTSGSFDVTFDGTGSTGATSYLWDFDDLTTSTSASVTHTFATAGTYLVTLTVSGPGGMAFTTAGVDAPCP